MNSKIWYINRPSLFYNTALTYNLNKNRRAIKWLFLGLLAYFVLFNIKKLSVVVIIYKIIKLIFLTKKIVNLYSFCYSKYIKSDTLNKL